MPDIARAAEDFVAQFGYRALSGVVHDPVQTAFVQFFQIEDDRTLLELVAPDGLGSKLSSAAKSGRGMHHMCYAVLDISDSCKRLSSQGMLVIQEPVFAVAFPGRRIAWLQGRNRVLTELVEEGYDEWSAPKRR